MVALQASESLQKRVDELADKANLGTLRSEEQAEYDRYLAANHIEHIERHNSTYTMIHQRISH